MGYKECGNSLPQRTEDEGFNPFSDNKGDVNPQDAFCRTYLSDEKACCMTMTLNFPIYITRPDDMNAVERQMYDYFNSYGMTVCLRKTKLQEASVWFPRSSTTSRLTPIQ